MLSNNQIKLINSLHSKKGRNENRQFLVEGEKGIQELLSSNFKISFIVLNESAPTFRIDSKIPIFSLEEKQLQKLSSLTSNNYGFAVVHFLDDINLFKQEKDSYSVVLDGIRDPGNLGTIIRICDWYGIKQIVLSDDCTEFYNPKVISATMGSFKRIRFIYTDLEEFFQKNSEIPVIGAYLDGECIHEFQFPSSGFILMGNESIGIRDSNLKFVTKKITIPRYGSAESLNVAISTGIILDNLKRSI
ncbi:RNA methyltransferase [Aquirufa sp. ROCK-SH2]